METTSPSTASVTPSFLPPAFEHRYADLSAALHAAQAPVPVAAPELLEVNASLAHELGLSAQWLASEDGVAMFAGNAVPRDAIPVATAYAGHQFGHFVPSLGDGRAVLLGELLHVDGQLREVQLKGAGRTPFSRGGDGRNWIGPVLREYVTSEAMHALGVPTTRALAAVGTGEPVQRETALPGAIIVRVARSHLRVGTFQYFAARGDVESLRVLVDFAIERHYPDSADESNTPLALLERVVAAQASLVAHWMSLGFIHGVMNTDNCSIAGDTIDYGPCAFMDAFEAAKVFSSIDVQGRYAWRNQPAIAAWNVSQLAQSLLPLIDANPERGIELAQASLDRFAPLYEQAWGGRLADKLGIDNVDGRARVLGEELLALMETGGVDFTRGFRALADEREEAIASLFSSVPDEIDAWRVRHAAALADGDAAESGMDASEIATRRQSSRQSNCPVRIPRNHQVERAIRAAIDERDLRPFQSLLVATADPYEHDERHVAFELPPLDEERVMQTFCGT